MGNNIRSFSEAIEQLILNFPKEKTEAYLRNDRVEIQVLKIGEGSYSIRIYGIEIARKANGMPIEYIEGNLREVEERLERENQEGVSTQEIGNPETLDIAYLNLEDSAATERRIQEEQTPSQQKTPEEKDLERKKGEELEKDFLKNVLQHKKDIQKEKQTGINNITNVLLRQQVEEQKFAEKRIREKQEDRVELNLTRENSSDEALKQWIFRTMKVNAQRVVRARTGNHTYKYEIYDHTGRNVADELLTPRIGGHDPRMQIWILDNNGHYVKKEVDSLLLTSNGRYGFATDRGNDVLASVPTTYQVTRLPGGEYIAVRALEQQKRNRDASGIEAVKDAVASKKSDHEMKEEIEAAKTAKKIETAKEDGIIDTDEVEVVELLRKEGFKKEEIDKIFQDIYQGTVKDGMTCGEVKQIVTMVRDLKDQGCPIDRIHEILKQNKNNLGELPGDDENDGQRTRGGDALEKIERKI